MAKAMMDAETLSQNLKHFSGTEQYFKHWLGIQYTDGVKYLADNAQAYWLIDAIASHQPRARRIHSLTEFQLWFLHVGNAHEFIKPRSLRGGTPSPNDAVLTCWEDSPTAETKPAIIQQIPMTDFPLTDIKLFLQDKVLLLPSEN
ncbi:MULTISPECIES: DUF6876 family protein [unclassified Microcoleus]|uniref:DUF6876 family protein n=1 Tax=unclassified Microcoleus TaxID=2642155 RepID=UPI002FCF6D0D